VLLSKTLTIIATCYKTWGTVGIVSSLANLRNIIRTVADFIIQWESRASMKNAVTSPFCNRVAQRHPRRKNSCEIGIGQEPCFNDYIKVMKSVLIYTNHGSASIVTPASSDTHLNLSFWSPSLRGHYKLAAKSGNDANFQRIDNQYGTEWSISS